VSPYQEELVLKIKNWGGINNKRPGQSAINQELAACTYRQ